MVKNLLRDEKLYFVAVVPPEPLRGELHQLKEYFRDKYNSSKSLNSPPHITLHMPFKWRESKEKKLLSALEESCLLLTPFEVALKRFAAFPPRVIYAEPVESPQLHDLQKTVARAMRLSLNLFNADYQGRGFHPHITLAFRDLKKPRFHEAWQEFENKPLKASFLVDNICLLKHNGSTWDIFQELPFGNFISAEKGERPSEETE
ncbi:MAG: 2'-5' RNA ligase family protein [Imperialibacter sp.]|uniref:2'-5' RNA ligase family protein n=1 Tax=Imperialibacter sp. TaxID=2038411 RepID=UPI003A8ADC01